MPSLPETMAEDEPTATPTKPVSTNPPTTRAPTTPDPTASPAFNVFFCGATYALAEANCLTAEPCPSGTGCSLPDEACFGISQSRCLSGAPTDAPKPTSPTTAGEPSPPTTRAPTTPGPTKSPVYNIYFCGVTYAEAEENCWTAEPCPSGTGCSLPGEACFGIGLPRCLSPAPTDAPTGQGPRPSAFPTISAAPTAPPTTTPAPTSRAPSQAPVVNTNFCGADYADAVKSCSDDTACPFMGCPEGLMCYTGITDCAAAAGSSNNAAVGSTPSLTFPAMPGESSPSLTFPTMPGNLPTAPSTPTPGQPTGATPQALPTSWLDNLDITEAPAPPVHMRYCGLSLKDAHDRCAVNTPCPDGRSDNCLAGQTCFPIPSACMEGVFPTPPTLSGSVTPPAAAVTPPAAAVAPSPVSPKLTAAPAALTTDKPVFDPTATQFCGMDYFDALNNCYKQRPCPNGTPEECPKGQGCYPGITKCQTPEPSAPVPSASPVQELAANLNDGGSDSAPMAPSASPVKAEISDWSWVINDSNGADGRSKRMSLFLHSLTVGGTIFGLILAL